MSDSLVYLEIVTPEKIFFSGEIKSLTAPGSEGSFQILPRHAPFISSIVPGVVRFTDKDGNTTRFATSGGTVEVHNNKIIMLAESVYTQDEIDLSEAEDELNNALKIIQSDEPGLDKPAAQLIYKTARAKIKVKNG